MILNCVLTEQHNAVRLACFRAWNEHREEPKVKGIFPSVEG